jgi:hypothetical protein
VLSLIKDRFDIWREKDLFHIKKSEESQQVKLINNPPIFIIHRKLTQQNTATNATKKCNTCKQFYKQIFSYKPLMLA